MTVVEGSADVVGVPVVVVVITASVTVVEMTENVDGTSVVVVVGSVTPGVVVDSAIVIPDGGKVANVQAVVLPDKLNENFDHINDNIIKEIIYLEFGKCWKLRRNANQLDKL